MSVSDDPVQLLHPNDTSISATEDFMVQIQKLHEENSQLRTLLSSSQQETADLNKVLEWNKNATCAALAHLKEEYDFEKSMVLDTMDKLKGLTKELRSMKRELVTFASLQEVYTERCDQYRSEVDGLKEQLSDVEEDRKALVSLLNMAIKQKVDLTLRLEDLEIEKEEKGLKRKRGSLMESTKLDGHTLARDFCCILM